MNMDLKKKIKKKNKPKPNKHQKNPKLTRKKPNTKKNPKTYQHIYKLLAWIFQLYIQPIISVTIYRHYKNMHI